MTPAGDRLTNRYRWWVIVILTVGAALNYADRAVISALLPLMRSGLGMSDVMLGAVSSVFLLSYAIGSPITGFVGDRLPRVKVIVWSVAVWSVATLLSGMAANSGQMLATRLLLGLSQCAYAPAAVALMAEFHPAGRRALAIVIPLAGCNLGFIGGSFLGGYSGDHFGWRPVFYVLGAFGLVLAWVCAVVLRPIDASSSKGALLRPESKEQPGGVGDPALPRTVRGPAAAPRISDIFRVRSYIIILIESCCLSTAGWVFLNWLAYYFHENFGMTLTGAALAGTVAIQLAATLGYALGGWVSDRFSRGARERRMLLQSICVFIAGPFWLIFATHAGLALLSAGIFIGSTFRALGSANDQVIICEVFPPRLRATAVGLMNGANIACGAVSVFLAGLFLKKIPLPAMFASLAVFYFIGAAFSMIGYRRYLRHDLVEAS